LTLCEVTDFIESQEHLLFLLQWLHYYTIQWSKKHWPRHAGLIWKM